MADSTFVFTGRYAIRPPVTSAGFTSNDPMIWSELAQTVAVKSKAVIPVSLDADAAETVQLGDVANVHVLVIDADAKVIARITSADGSAQIVPCDFLLVKSLTVPYTALTLQRQVGIATKVRVTACEKV